MNNETLVLDKRPHESLAIIDDGSKRIEHKRIQVYELQVSEFNH